MIEAINNIFILSTPMQISVYVKRAQRDDIDFRQFMIAFVQHRVIKNT